MIWLALSIGCSTLIFLLFKYFERYKVHTLTAIVGNYAVAVVLGLALAPSVSPGEWVSEPWFPFAAFIGCLFVGLFFLIAKTAQTAGVAVASVANKLSLVIPVVASVWLYQESMPALRIAGIGLALVAVVLVAWRGNGQKATAGKLILPAVLFLGSGLLDTLIKYCEHYYIKGDTLAIFVPVSFAFALVMALVVAMVRKDLQPSGKSWLAGILLGLPNFGSIYFFMKTLETAPFESNAIFPINNMGVVALSAVAAWLLLRERLSTANWVGIILSLAAIALV